MGLSGATKKQRIQDDPRNLRWATDTSAPGFRLLASMGWNPDSNPQLGNASSQAAISANGGSGFSRKIAAIPIAKDDTLGIGMKRGSAAAVVGSLKAMGVASGANSTTAGSGFVTAGSGSSTPQNGVAGGGSGGGEFGSLLARLNKLKEQNGGLSASASPAPEGDDKPSQKKRKRSSSESSSDDSSSESAAEKEAAASPAPVVASSASASPAPTPATLAALKNPRMAARSKHLRAKRMATASNASAMAEILGLAPPTSATPSPAPSGSSTPVLAVNGPRTDGWPSVPPRGCSSIAVSTTTTMTTTVSTAGVGAAPKAAKAGSEPVVVEEEKERSRSPSPEFKVHSAKFDPFKVTSDTPTVASAPAAGLSSVFGRMFVGSSAGGMGATFVPPSASAPVVEKKVEEPAKVKKNKKEKKEKKREGETKEERRARKEAKRAKKAKAE
ncbi:Proteophosphoglycan 5 [Rhodotorula toruloides ATCC 204091]|uniref:BY PROTMAP: gi/342321351/gb/EGU13285.1/ Proteophosphoglycan 5 [Rhodotorula glutinis ATCC 204091] n=1 Tax=Rhodotorula toruloides TaxID=5286 RepID=A0A0K3CP91_RHOTO|nr:Proteophosphoglycan 5 [Rhodotorula toruloides ATCC 204091]